jgi:hypothetical protein
MIFEEVGIPDRQEFIPDVDEPLFGLTLLALAPTIGFLMSIIDYEDCERYWRLCLELRAQTLDPECVGEIEGRA